MRKFYPYNPASTVQISDEPHQIIDGKIRLDHLPKLDSLTVRGFTAANSAARLQPNEFYCNYRADSVYREANREVYFYSGRSGQTVYCSYIAVGTVVTADDMNEIGGFIDDASQKITAAQIDLTTLRNTLITARAEAKIALAEHDLSKVAHSDLRDLIANLRASLDSAQIYQAKQLNDLRGDFNSHQQTNDNTFADIYNLLGSLGETIISKLDIGFNVDTETFLNYVFDRDSDSFTPADLSYVFADDERDDDLDISYIFADDVRDDSIDISFIFEE